MTDEESYAAFLQQEERDRQLLERFDRHLQAYLREHPNADYQDLHDFSTVLESAMPGLREAIGRRALADQIQAALVADRGDGLPACGPSHEREADGERFWKTPERWSVEDFRVTLAW